MRMAAKNKAIRFVGLVLAATLLGGFSSCKVKNPGNPSVYVIALYQLSGSTSLEVTPPRTPPGPASNAFVDNGDEIILANATECAWNLLDDTESTVLNGSSSLTISQATTMSWQVSGLPTTGSPRHLKHSISVSPGGNCKIKVTRTNPIIIISR
jgi:hypothetical protein